MIVCVIGLFWAVTLKGDTHTWAAAFLFTSSGALVAFTLLRYIDRLGAEVDVLQQELAELRAALAGGPQPEPEAEEEQQEEGDAE